MGLVPTTSDASNETHKRTPAIWDVENAECGISEPDVACGVVIDRSGQTQWHLAYGIPFEDTEVTTDEVVDSRRHQFFATCRQRLPVKPWGSLPNWINDADVQAAGDVIVCVDPDDDGPEECGPLVDPQDVEAEDVLESNTQWAGCWERITADADRRPITCAMADAGTDWNLSGLQTGVYVIEGYTWEPAFNLWSQRPGFVKVVDDPDDVAQDVPAGAMMPLGGDGLVYTKEITELSACVDAMDGSTMSADWAALPVGNEELTWHRFIEDQSIDSGSFTLEFEAPEESEWEFIVLRMIVEDPMGRTWTAYSSRELEVVPGVDCEDDGGGLIPDPNCEDTGDDGTTDDGETTGDEAGTSTGTGTETGSSGANDNGGANGCRCWTGPTSPPGWLLLTVAPLLLRRRRA